MNGRRPNPAARFRPGKKTTLAAVIGTPLGAAALMVAVPQEESGRQQVATVHADQSVTARHVRGRLYTSVYLDIIGVPTACDGITRFHGQRLRRGMKFTEAQCQALLEEELIAHAQPVVRCIPALYGRTWQVVPIVSLSFNIGPTGVCRGSVAKAINAGNWAAASRAILLYNKAGGRWNRGLADRRGRERCLFDLNRPDLRGGALPAASSCAAFRKHLIGSITYALDPKPAK